MNSESQATDRALGAFFMKFAADRERQVVQPLSEYLRIFPSHEDEVAREYLQMTDAGHEVVAHTVTREANSSQIGPYQIEEEIGRGGQATVYLAIDTRIGRQVALKVLHAPLGGVSTAVTDRFRREAELLARLDHPGICIVHDAEFGGDAPYLAMRYVRGQSLGNLIESSRAAGSTSVDLPLTDDNPLHVLLSYFEQAARALHAAHESGLVHRDIKPGNLMVAPGGDPVILDFGLAHDESGSAAPMTMSGQVLGTPAYMAPELLGGQIETVDRRCDIYALGLALYECATLQRAFQASTRDALFHQILTSNPTELRRVNPALPRDLSVVVLTAIEKRPDLRYRTAIEFAEDLRRIRVHEPVHARRAGPGLRLLRFVQRHPVPTLVAIIVIAVLGASLVVTRSSLELAEKERDAKDATLSEFQELLGLADSQVLKQLRREARSLRFVHDEVAPPDWIGRARALYATLPRHKKSLAQLRKTAVSVDPAAKWSTYEFATPSSDWRHATLVALIDDIQAFAEEIDRNVTLWQLTTQAASRAESVDSPAWSAARERVAVAPVYANTTLPVQPGLVPLGPDPNSGLEEFAHLASGSVPVRDAASGELNYEIDSAIVFVLIPGGEAVIGASQRSGSEHHDPSTQDDEGPIHRVELDPFLLAKFEVTQAQYVRLVGRNPSNFKPGSTIRGKTTTLLHPVEWVSWSRAQACLVRFGLALPTEVQWEYALRGGTTTAFVTGSRAETLDGSINAFDRTGKLGKMRSDVEPVAWLDDGYVHHAPVGSFAANQFGMHDMLGNVGEWCRDTYHPYSTLARGGDGLRGTADGDEHILRGGSFYHTTTSFRSANRGKSGVFYGLNLGFRAARALE